MASHEYGVMLDLETLGTAPGCVILAIGAVYFGPDGLGCEFSRVITRESCRSVGLWEDPATLAWWAQQSAEARTAVFENPRTISLPDALDDLAGFLPDPHLPTSLLWGNGAGFDPPLLEAAHRVLAQPVPWAFASVRCYRTLKSFSRLEVSRSAGTHHTALGDAKNQALHAIAIMKELGLALAT